MPRGRRRRRKRASRRPPLRKESSTVICTAKALELSGLRTVKAELHRVRYFAAVDAQLLVHYCEHWSCTFPAVTVEAGLALCFRHARHDGDFGVATGLDCVGRESAGGLPDQLRVASNELLATLVHEYYVSCMNGFYLHEDSPPSWVAAAYEELQRGT